MGVFQTIRAASLLAAAAGLSLAACTPVETDIPDDDSVPIVADHDGTTLAGYLAKPQGEGPFPAVVLMHGCGGLQKNTSEQTTWRAMSDHADLLNENGYVTLILDSFSPRGVESCGGDFNNSMRLFPLLVKDSEPAFDYLVSLSFVDEARIGYAGFSLGGVAALHVASNHRQNARNPRVDRDYAASVAYYPHCGEWEKIYDFANGRPLTILIGADDTWTPTPLCRALADHWADDVDIEIYSNAYHGFDLPTSRRKQFTGVDGKVRIWGANPEARRKSQARMLTFFEEHLGPTR